MSFIKPIPNHWQPADFDLSAIMLDHSIEHIAKTICLLESRCDDYAEYLRAIFVDRDPAWNEAIDQWNSEECQHGVMLRYMCEAVDTTFPFPQSMSHYESLVSYHDATGVSVRGSVGAEMVSRCVVEALASTLYRVLADAVIDPKCQDVFAALAQDEARHFGMFLKMLDAESERVCGLGIRTRCVFALKRMMELEDAQIMEASYVVARRPGAIRRRREANWYLGQLYHLYQWKHLRYAVQMLLRTVGIRPRRPIAALITGVLWSLLKLRWIWAVIVKHVLPPRPSSPLPENAEEAHTIDQSTAQAVL